MNILLRSEQKENVILKTQEDSISYIFCNLFCLLSWTWSTINSIRLMFLYLCISIYNNVMSVTFFIDSYHYCVSIICSKTTQIYFYYCQPRYVLCVDTNNIPLHNDILYQPCKCMVDTVNTLITDT